MSLNVEEGNSREGQSDAMWEGLDRPLLALKTERAMSQVTGGGGGEEASRS